MDLRNIQMKLPVFGNELTMKNEEGRGVKDDS